MNSTSTPATPVTVIGGFLGAGKTTFLNRLIARSGLPRYAVLVNDFGDVSIDASLVREHGGDTIALTNGCVCCTIGSDLGTTLATVLATDPAPEHVLIEASGVAEPDRIGDVARLAPDLVLHRVLVLADGPRVLRQLCDRWAADTVDRQLRSGDAVLVSKLDQIDPTEGSRVLRELAQRFGEGRVMPLDPDAWERTVSRAASAGAPPLVNPFVTRTLRGDEPLDAAQLKLWLSQQSDIYRLKGWFQEKRTGHTLLAQGVASTLTLTPADLEPVSGFELMCIGSPGLSESGELLESLRAACV